MRRALHFENLMNPKVNPKQEHQSEGPMEGNDQNPFIRVGGLFIWLLVLIFLIIWVWSPLSTRLDDEARINYSTFRTQLEDGNVSWITVTGEKVQGLLKKPSAQEVSPGEIISYSRFVTYLPSFGDEELFSQLRSQGVEVQTEPEQDASWRIVLLNLLPFLLFIGFIVLLMRRAQTQGGNILGMGSSPAKAYDRSFERTTFEDVAGVREAKTELREMIEFLKDPSCFRTLGAEIPGGVLLLGPPGTGKTLLARAVAGEADVPFFSITGSDFMEMFVGVGASRVRNLFREAKKNAPSIIFIDEIDAIGRRRGAGLGGGHDEREQTLNQLLSEMDGFESSRGVVLMAATNRPDILDPALLRPGRFDRRITLDLPTMRDRFAILKIHARNKPLSKDVDLERLARGTPGFSGADLENLLNEAALLAARKKKTSIESEDIEEARDKVLMGPARESLVLTPEERRLLAYHEAGHAVVAAVLPHADPIHKVTIVPRGSAMGSTQQLPKRDKYIYSREFLLDRLAVMMGGQAAETIVFDTATSGVENDLRQATTLARQMILDWGMSDRLGHMIPGSRREQVFLGEEIVQKREYSEATAREIDEEIKSILDGSYKRAFDTLRQHREGLDQLAELLLEEEEITGDQVLALLEIEANVWERGPRREKALN